MTLKEYFAQVILVYSIKEMEENVYMKRLLVYSKKYWIQMIAAAISRVNASIYSYGYRYIKGNNRYHF